MAKREKSKKTIQTKRRASSKQVAKKPEKLAPKDRVILRIRGFLARRPHRSFRRTRRRDYVRSLILPGYFSFTKSVLSHIWKYRRVFGGLVLVYTIASAILVGLISQTDFKEMADMLAGANTDTSSNFVDSIGNAGLLLMGAVSGSLSPAFGEAQQLLTALLFLMAWLSSVWLLRAQMAGGAPRLRDALYNCGAPIISTIVVGCLLLVQMLPALLGVILYGTAVSTNFLTTGAIAMVVSLITFLLIALSIYLLTSGFFALIVVTLPGMYPWRAIRTAGDLVVGRRLRIILRLTWAILVIALIWAIAMIPVILLSTWLQSSFAQLAWVPIVPVVLTLASSLSVVFMSAYVYMLYRKVVDDDAAPA